MTEQKWQDLEGIRYVENYVSFVLGVRVARAASPTMCSRLDPHEASGDSDTEARATGTGELRRS
jgi:hypothetical protein